MRHNSARRSGCVRCCDIQETARRRHLDLLRAIILGIIQALTEFLPISSSAHLILFRNWIGLDSVDGLAFDVALHLGSVVAIVVYFRRDLLGLVRGGFSIFRGVDLRQNVEQRLAWYIVMATVPAALAGYFLGDIIEHVVRTPWVIVVTLIVGGVLFLVVERVCRPSAAMNSITARSALFVGIAQAVALIPGVSRSGITIVTGMTQNLKREQAARFSFLLSVPIMLGAAAKEAMELPGLALDSTQIAMLLTGMVVSSLAAWIVIKYFLRFLQRHSLDVFAYYRFGLAVVVMIWLLAA